MNVVTKGYKIPWKNNTPPPGNDPKAFLKNNNSALQHRDYIEEQISAYEQLGYIKHAHKRPKRVMPLSYVFSNKPRMIGDASQNLNEYIEDRQVKLSHLRVANEGLEEGLYMTTADLEAGYQQVPINPADRCYLGIAWTKNGKTVYFIWCVLFLKIKDAVFLFTKLLRGHIKLCQKFGIFIKVFIDDQRILGRTYKECQLHTKFALLALELAGWKIKPGKGYSTPVQYGTFLGYDHDLVNLYYFIPEKKIQKIRDMALWLMGERRVKSKTLASFKGKIASCDMALGPVHSLLVRSMNYDISVATSKSWNTHLTISADSHSEIKYIYDYIHLLNGYPINGTPYFIPMRTMVSDASAKGLASAEVLCSPSHIHIPHSGPCVDSPLVQRAFDTKEYEGSSTLREISSLWDTYVLNGKKFEGQKGTSATTLLWRK